MRCCEKGRSMIEMLGVLAIVGVLSVGGIAGYATAMNKLRSQKTSEQLNEIVMNIRNLYINQNDYNGLSHQLLIQTGMAPASTINPVDPNDNLVNAFGGNFILFESKDQDGNMKAFEIYATGLDKKTCVIMSTLDWGIDPTSGFMALYIGTQTPTTPLLFDITELEHHSPANGIFTSGIHDEAIPLTVPRAMSVCNCPLRECVIGLKYS